MTLYRPTADPGESAQQSAQQSAQARPAGTVSPYPTAPPARVHILVVNGRKVRHPVFVLGAPCSGAGRLARAIKRTDGFHLTLGQRHVLPVVHAFARRPSIPRGRPLAAATVLRDALAQAWQVTPACCLGCTPQCREAGGVDGVGPCISVRGITRYGDASPDLLYCADALLAAFPDARLIQIIRDGRDVVTGMLGDPQSLAWFRPGFVDTDAEFPHPLLGLETPEDRTAWPALTPAGKSAMRWRGTVRQMARLRSSLAAEQLITLRYEEMIRQPEAAAAAVSAFIGAPVPAGELAAGPAGRPGRGRRHDMHGQDRQGQDRQGQDRQGGGPAPWGDGPEPGGWRRLLTAAQSAEVDMVAGEELRRVGYGL